MNPLLGEFMGTLVLVLIGNGTVANVVLKKTLGNGSGWPVIISGFGFGVMAAIFVAQACGSPGAHINPAVTLALAVASGNFADVPGRIAFTPNFGRYFSAENPRQVQLALKLLF